MKALPTSSGRCEEGPQRLAVSSHLSTFPHDGALTGDLPQNPPQVTAKKSNTAKQAQEGKAGQSQQLLTAVVLPSTNPSLTPKLGSGSRRGVCGPSAHVGPSSPCPQRAQSRQSLPGFLYPSQVSGFCSSFTPRTLCRATARRAAPERPRHTVTNAAEHTDVGFRSQPAPTPSALPTWMGYSPESS